MNGLENWWESCFTRTIHLHTSLWLQWLLCVTVALNWLITLHILLIWHHLTIFWSPTCKHTWLGSIRPMMRSYLQLRTFSRIRMRAFIPRVSKHCNSNEKQCVGRRGDYVLFKKNIHLVKLDHCIIAYELFSPPSSSVPLNFSWIFVIDISALSEPILLKSTSLTIANYYYVCFLNCLQLKSLHYFIVSAPCYLLLGLPCTDDAEYLQFNCHWYCHSDIVNLSEKEILVHSLFF